MEIQIQIDVQAQSGSRKDSTEDAATSRLELKYCEGCGALTLRPASSSEIYCPRCSKKFAELPSGDNAGRRS